jgi:oligopeptide/dipeptide ABC transporter ATP-binding protein
MPGRGSISADHTGWAEGQMLLSVVRMTKEFPVSRGLMGRPTAHVRAVQGLSFEIGDGEIVGLVGESGCGKSTVGKCTVGLTAPTSGDILWDGETLRGMDRLKRQSLRSRFQLLFQNPYASLNPRQKVRSILTESMEAASKGMGQREFETVGDLLGLVGLSGGDLDKYPHEFSGGQRQRIALARALALRPSLLVLDEPVSSLDVSIQASILNLLIKMNREKGVAYLFISHDLQVVAYLSQRMMVMYLGRVVEEGRTEEVLRKPRHPYTRVLLEASQGQGGRVAGEPPSLVHAPAGCPFHSRCPFAEDKCRNEEPFLDGSGDPWRVACWKWMEI